MEKYCGYFDADVILTDYHGFGECMECGEPLPSVESEERGGWLVVVEDGESQGLLCPDCSTYEQRVAAEDLEQFDEGMSTAEWLEARGYVTEEGAEG